MKYARFGTLAVSVAAVAVFASVPAQADPVDTNFLNDTSFLNSLNDSSGLSGIDPSTAVSVGQSVCPMLSQPGQQLADVASSVSDTLGRPLGPATMFTGLAITWFCPGAVASLANGDSPIPLGLLGF
jgi:hypothetical protein